MKKPLLVAACAVLVLGGTTGLAALANAEPPALVPAAPGSVAPTTRASVPVEQTIPVSALTMPEDAVINQLAKQLNREPGAVRAAFSKVIADAKAAGGSITTAQYDAQVAAALGVTVEVLRAPHAPATPALS